MLEYGNIGVLGFKCITPLLHHSSTPVSTTLERAVRAQRSRWAFFSRLLNPVELFGVIVKYLLFCLIGQVGAGEELGYIF
jgi:hypothetical protein